MPKPTTPLCGADVFIVNEQQQVLLIQRSDNQLWALPGGCQDLSETPAECAIRECFEETGYKVKIVSLIGVWSSLRYEYVHYPWKDNVFTHLVFQAVVVGGAMKTSDESIQVKYFSKKALPELSDGHATRIEFSFKWLFENKEKVYFE